MKFIAVKSHTEPRGQDILTGGSAVQCTPEDHDLDDVDGPPVLRKWKGPREVRLHGDEEENPFGLPPPVKERVVVLHPEVLHHMSTMTKGRFNSLKMGLSKGQVDLLREDFLDGLDFWSGTWCCSVVEMWRALEASKYCELNPEIGQADIDVAVKLLIPLDLAQDAPKMRQDCWSISVREHLEGLETFRTKFSIVPSPTVRKGTPKPNALQPPGGAPLASGAQPKPPPPGLKLGPVVVSASYLMPPPAPKVPWPSSLVPPSPPPSVKQPSLPLPGTSSATCQGASIQFPKTVNTVPPVRANLGPEIVKKVKEDDSSDDSSSVEAEDEEEKDWTAAKMQKVKLMILQRHEASRTAHGSAGTDEAGLEHYSELKYKVFMRHLEHDYEENGVKIRGPVPPKPEQTDELISAVVQDCRSCRRLRQTRLQEQASDKATRDRRRDDWNLRYQHRLEADEYETDDGHVGDLKCGKCNLPGGRRGKMGKTYGDSLDRDELVNCAGKDCTKAFHQDCRPGLIQDSPESRRAHGLPGDVPLTFGRRLEPHLCPECWHTAGRKQLEQDRLELQAQRDALQAKTMRKRDRKRARKADH